MQKKNSQPFSKAMSDFFSANNGLKMKLAEYRAVNAWHEVLGEGVSKYTKSVYFRRNILYVQLSSAVLRAELLINKKGLIEKINEYAEAMVVKDIVLR